MNTIYILPEKLTKVEANPLIADDILFGKKLK